MSFDPRAAFKVIDGRTLQPQEMYRELKNIRREHFRELPIEFTVEDLFVLAQRHRWVHEEQDGRLRIALT